MFEHAGVGQLRGTRDQRAGGVGKGRVSEMARMLGIGRSTLWRKMKQLDLSPKTFKK